MLIVAGGPMFAGKTTWLLNYIKDLPEGTFQLFKPNIDVRYSKNEVVSHNGKRLPAVNLSIDNPKLPKLTNKISVILIDELNFFQPEKLIPLIKKQLKKGKTVIGAGLVYDYLKKPFGSTIPLQQIADETVVLYAKCDNCGKNADHSYRKTGKKAQVVIGAAEAYGAACAVCWETLSKTN